MSVGKVSTKKLHSQYKHIYQQKTHKSKIEISKLPLKKNLAVI